MLKRGQILIEQENNNCAIICNDYAVSKNDLLNVEIVSEYQTIHEDNFENYDNFDTIIDIGQSITITTPPAFIPNPIFPNVRTSFFFYTPDKLFVFVIRNIGTSPYEILYDNTATDNDLVVIGVRFSATANTMRNMLVQAMTLAPSGVRLQDYFDSTIINTGAGILLTNANSKLAFIPINHSSVNPTPTTIQSYFGYNNYLSVKRKSIVAFNFDKYYNVAGASTWGAIGFAPFIINYINLQNQKCKKARISFSVTNNNAFDISFNWRFKNPVGFQTPIINQLIPANTTQNIVHEFTLLNGTYLANDGQFVVEFAEPTPNTNQFVALDEWLQFDSFKLETRDNLTGANITDCNGTNTISITNDTIDLSPYDGYVSIQLLLNCDTPLDTQPIKLLEDTNCNNYYKISWLNKCTEKQYTGYFLGILTKKANEVVQNETYIKTDGKKVSIYKHTIGVYEFIIQPYTADFQENLEVAMLLDDLMIDDKLFYQGENTLQVDEIGDTHVYSGRIDLYKDGTEFIKKLCC